MTSQCARRIGWILLATAVVALPLTQSACSKDKSTDGGTPSLDPWFADDYMTSYTEVGDCRNSISHNGNSIVVRITPENADAYRNGQALPEGCIIVKTEWGGPECVGPPDRITVMRKGPPGTATEGDWEWQEFIYTKGQESQREGVLSDCLACHRDCVDHDYTCLEGRI
jgi:hypothetical protein